MQLTLGDEKSILILIVSCNCRPPLLKMFLLKFVLDSLTEGGWLVVCTGRILAEPADKFCLCFTVQLNATSSWRPRKKKEPKPCFLRCRSLASYSLPPVVSSRPDLVVLQPLRGTGLKTTKCVCVSFLAVHGRPTVPYFVCPRRSL